MFNMVPRLGRNTMSAIVIQIITTFVTVIATLFPAVWAMVKMVFPKYMDVYIKRIEYAHNRDIKELEASLNSQIETLKTSVEIARKSEEELQSKRIASVEKLWQEIMRLRREFAPLVAIESILTEEELYQAFQSCGDNENEKIDEIVKAYASHQQITKKLDNNTTGNIGGEMAVSLGSAPYPMAEPLIFVTEDVHRIYGAIVRLYGRVGMLLAQQTTTGQVSDWRDDHMMREIINTVLPDGTLDVIQKNKISIQTLVDLFEQQVISEAKKAIHGAESLTKRVKEVHQMIEEQEADAKNRQIGIGDFLSG